LGKILAPYSQNVQKYPMLKKHYLTILNNTRGQDSAVLELITEVRDSIPVTDILKWYQQNMDHIRWMNLFHYKMDMHAIPSYPAYSNIMDGKEDYFKFCVCRNPWDYAFSVFKNKVVIDEVSKNFKDGMDWDHEVSLLLSTSKFQNFIREIDRYEDIQKNFINPNVQQLSYITSKNQVLVDRVIRFENLQKEIIEVQDLLNISINPMPELNVSVQKNRTHKEYVGFYDDFSRDYIAKVFQADIEYFEYEF